MDFSLVDFHGVNIPSVAGFKPPTVMSVNAQLEKETVSALEFWRTQLHHTLSL